MSEQSPLFITLGSDPELMLQHNHTGEIVSSIPILKKDKTDPIDLGDGFKFYADNVLAEFAMPPSPSRGGLVMNLRKSFLRGQEWLGPEYSLVPRASHVYDERHLQDKQAKEVGCNPNIDAYREEPNISVPFSDGLRTGSFHVHIGNRDYEKGEGLLVDHTTKLHAIKLLDIFVGCASVVFDKDTTGPRRRKLYGRAGEFRPTPYGIEYRVLGPYALACPQLVMLVTDLVYHSMDVMENERYDELLEDIDPVMVRTAINRSQPKLAETVLGRAQLPVNLMQRIRGNYSENFRQSWGI